MPMSNCCHFMRSSVRPTVHELGFWYCEQISWKKSLYFGTLMYPDDLTSVYLFLWVLLSVRRSSHHVFRFLCIYWKITWKERYWHVDVSRSFTLGRHRCRWILLSFHEFVHPSDHPWDWVWILQTNRMEEMVYILACWCIQMIFLQFIDAYGHNCPSVCWSFGFWFGLG